MRRALFSCFFMSLSFLNMGFLGKPVIESLYCGDKESLEDSFVEKWENYPWIYDKKTGKLYDYDPSSNEINVLSYDQDGEFIYTYKSKIIKNTLHVTMTETSPGNAPNLTIFSMDLDKLESTDYPLENPNLKTVYPCVKLALPEGVKINY